MPQKSNNDQPTILLLASGFISSKTSGRNLGDVAQQQNGVKGLRANFANPKILAIANSFNESSELEGIEFSKKLIRYLSAANPEGFLSRALPRRAAAALNILLLVWNARRVQAQKQPIFLSAFGKEALDELRNADGVYISGAGNFNDQYMLGVGFFWSTIINCASILGIPTVLSGQQIGPLDRKFQRTAAAWGLKSANIVGVRETISYDVACGIGVPQERVILTGDGAWGLPPAGTDKATELLTKLGISGPYIAAQFRFDFGTQWTNNDAEFLGKCLDVLSDRLGLPVVFVPMCYSEPEDDRSAAKIIASFMKSKSVSIETPIDADLTKAVLGEAKLAFGVSNHFCVFAASMSTPTLCLYRSPYLGQKLEGLSKIWPHVVSVPLKELTAVDILADKANELISALPETKTVLPRVSEGPFRMEPDAPLRALKNSIEKNC